MSFIDLLHKVGGFVKHSAVVVSDAFAKVVGHDNAVNFGHAALGMLQSDLGVIVVDAVKAVQTLDPNASGDQKKSQAFAQVLVDSKAKGIETSNSIISLLVELAVGVLKGHYGPVS